LPHTRQGGKWKWQMANGKLKIITNELWI
jgi:hypothetical protein